LIRGGYRGLEREQALEDAMNRRALIVGLTIAGVWPAAAQIRLSQDASSSPAVPSTAAPAPAEVLGLGDAEKHHIAQTMTIGTVSLEQSKLALKEAQHPKVKQFAQLETTEQETLAEALKAISAAADTKPAPDLSGDALAPLQKLREAGRGVLDRDFVRAQLTGHEKLLKVQEDYLAVGRYLPNIVLANLAHSMIWEHLILLHDLQETVG
jgi:putative membrane protein